MPERTADRASRARRESAPKAAPSDSFVARVARGRFWYLLARGGGDGLRIPFVFLNGALSMAILGAVALVLRWPLIFPPLGPTAFLIFSRPSTPEASPRSALLGHFMGAVCGFLSVALVGVVAPLGEPGGELALGRLVAAALAMGGTGSLLLALRAQHAPAASTALIVALGALTEGVQLAGLLLALILLCAQGWVFNRIAGIYYPAWRVRRAAPPSGVLPRALMHDDPLPEAAGPTSYAELAEEIISRRGRARGP